MKHLKWIKTVFVGLLLTACGTASKIEKSQDAANLLTAEQRRKFDYYFLEANKAKGLDKHDTAFDLFRKAVSIDSQSAPARFELANYYLQLQRPLVALEYLEGATKSEPNNFWYGMMEGHVLQSLNFTDQAVAVYQRLAAVYPEKPEIKYTLSEVYAQKGELQHAIDALESIEESNGVMEPIALEIHRLYMAMNQPEKAFDEIRKLIQAYPYMIRYRLLLGDLYLQAGMPIEAKQAYDEAAQIEASNPYLLISLSRYYNIVGDVDAFNALVRSALINNDLDVADKITILLDFIRTLFHKEESFGEMDALFRIIIDQHPLSSEVHEMYAELLIIRTHLVEAREQLNYATKLNPTEQRLWRMLIGVDLRLQNWSGMLQTTQEALIYLPMVPELYIYRAIAYASDSQNEKALATLQDALSKVGMKSADTTSEIWGQIGDIYHAMGQKDRSYEAYDEALKFNERNIVVLNNYSYFLSLDKSDLSKAERMSGKVVELDPNNPTYLDTYAWIYFQQGNYMLASFYIRSAINKGGDKEPEIIDHYGDILFKMDSVDEAVEQWKKALDLGKDTPLMRKKIETKSYHAE